MGTRGEMGVNGMRTHDNAHASPARRQSRQGPEKTFVDFPAAQMAPPGVALDVNTSGAPDAGKCRL